MKVHAAEMRERLTLLCRPLEYLEIMLERTLVFKKWFMLSVRISRELWMNAGSLESTREA